MTTLILITIFTLACLLCFGGMWAVAEIERMGNEFWIGEIE